MCNSVVAIQHSIKILFQALLTVLKDAKFRSTEAIVVMIDSMISLEFDCF